MSVTETIRNAIAQRLAVATSAPSRREVRTAVQDFDRPRWFEVYGSFTTPEEITAEPIEGLTKESGHIRRELVQFVDSVAVKAPLFLPGEPGEVVPTYAEWLELDSSQITTAGLAEDVDVVWNFEDDPPAGLGPFALIVSQAMIEHLIDPYKHVRDQYALLGEGGNLILHTVVPGFGYHRHPVDCVRFFPDWFEEVADRLGAEISGRFVGELHILYQFTKAIAP
jgi:hypothetical protein